MQMAREAAGSEGPTVLRLTKLPAQPLNARAQIKLRTLRPKQSNGGKNRLRQAATESSLAI